MSNYKSGVGHTTGFGGILYDAPEKDVNVHKEAPRVKKQKVEVIDIPSSVIVNFNSQDGDRAGPPIDLPTTSTQKQLELLINSLLANDRNIPYAFYVNDIEIVSSLKETLDGQIKDGEFKQSFEDTLNISFQPLSVFRVRPVTRCVETMPGHTDAVLHVSYSPDGSRLASGGGDLAVRFWNVNTSMPAHTCLGHKHHVLCTLWSPDGSIFISGDRSGEIRLWDPKTGIQRGQPLKGHRKWITSLAYEPLHMDPTCRRMVSASKDHTMKIWNTHTGLCEGTICGHMDSVECVKWGGCGLIYSCSRDRTIKVWAVDGHGRSLHMLVRTLTGHAHRINSLALNCDYVLRTGAFKLGLIGASVNSQTVSSDVGLVPSTSSIQMSLTSELAEKQAIALERYNSVVGSEGERLVSGSDDFTLFMWKPSELKSPLLRMTGHQQLINQIMFSPDGRFFASASFDKKVKLWCGKTGRFISTLTGHVGSVYAISWSADSQYLVSASKDSTVKLWNVKDTKKAMFTLPGHADEVYTIDWSPNGTQVASGSKDRTIKIWHH